MGKVGRPEKFEDLKIKQAMLWSKTYTKRAAQNYLYACYAATALKEYVKDRKDIKYLDDKLINTKTEEMKDYSTMVELGRLYYCIAEQEGHEVASDFLGGYTTNLLILTMDLSLKSKEMQQEVRDKKKEIQAIYK